jgi:hypothetical protein
MDGHDPIVGHLFYQDIVAVDEDAVEVGQELARGGELRAKVSRDHLPVWQENYPSLINYFGFRIRLPLNF